MLIDHLFQSASRHPQQIAVVDEKGQHTYQQIAAMTTGLSLYLSMQTENKNVGLLLPAGRGFHVSFYATLLAGKSAVLMNYLLGDREIAHVIKDSAIDTVLTIPQLAGRVADSKLNVIDLTQLAGNIPAGVDLGAMTPEIPKTNAGVARPTTAKNTASRPKRPSGRAAPATPIVSPIVSAIAIAHRASSAVAGNRSSTTFSAGAR